MRILDTLDRTVCTRQNSKTCTEHKIDYVASVELNADKIPPESPASATLANEHLEAVNLRAKQFTCGAPSACDKGVRCGENLIHIRSHLFALLGFSCFSNMEKLSLLPAKVRLSAPDWYLHPFVQEGEVAAHLDTGLGFLGWRHARDIQHSFDLLTEL